MVDFENRNAAYVRVREYRKRRKPPFAGRHHLNLNTPEDGRDVRFLFHWTIRRNACFTSPAFSVLSVLSVRSVLLFGKIVWKQSHGKGEKRTGARSSPVLDVLFGGNAPCGGPKCPRSQKASRKQRHTGLRQMGHWRKHVPSGPKMSQPVSLRGSAISPLAGDNGFSRS